MKFVFVLVIASVAAAQESGGASGTPPTDRNEVARPIIAGVEFSGVRGADLGAIHDNLHISPGDTDDFHVAPGNPLSRSALAKVLRALHHSGKFSAVQVFVTPVAAAVPVAGSITPERVTLLFSCTPRRLLSGIAFQGVRALEEAVLVRAANLSPGTEYLPSRAAAAAEAIRTVYFRSGYRQASVVLRPRQVGEDVSLEAEVHEGEPTRITSVAFLPTSALSAVVLRAALGLGPGDILNLEALAAGVQSLQDRFRKERYLRATVSEPQLEFVDALHVRVLCNTLTGPRVTFVVRGNRRLSTQLLKTKLTDTGDGVLDEIAKQDLAGRLSSFYETMGFLHLAFRNGAHGAPLGEVSPVSVSVREVPARKPGEVLVSFSVVEGNPRPVAALHFAGNTRFSEADLRARVQQVLAAHLVADPDDTIDPETLNTLGVMGRLYPAPKGHTTVDPEAVYVPRLYQQALRSIEDLYKSQGYLDARVDPPQIRTALGDRLNVEINVKEGVQTLVSGIKIVDVVGDIASLGVGETTLLRSALSTKVGEPLRYYDVTQDVDRLAKHFGHLGHLFAHVEDREEFDADRRHAKLVFAVNQGPEVRVSRVELRGFRRTSPGVINDAVELHAGDVFDPEKLLRSQQALIQSALFLSASVVPSDPDVVEKEKAVVVTVREDPLDSIEWYGGASLADGPRTVVTWVHQNQLGLGESFSVAAKLNYPILRYSDSLCNALRFNTVGSGGCVTVNPPLDFFERKVDFSFTLPHAYGISRSLSLRVDVLHERAIRPAYLLENGGASFTVSLNVGNWRAQLQPGVEADQIARNDSAFGLDLSNATNLQLFRIPDGVTVLGTLGGSLIADYRDDANNPGRGFLGQVSAELDHAFFARHNPKPGERVGEPFDVQFVKPELRLSGYIPLGKPRWTLALSGRAGVVVKLSPTSETILPKRFYLGGSQTLRGFHEDQLIPQDRRADLSAEVKNCQLLISGASCTSTAQALVRGQPIPSEGGQAFGLFKLELRFPIFSLLDGGVFVDAGNLWVDPQQAWAGLDQHTVLQVLRELRWAVGFGARYLTPIGPASLDLGINVQPDPLLGEAPYYPNISIGLF